MFQVPNVISHTTFWQRYFFRLFLLDREEKKRNDILARANTSTSKDDDSTDGWGDDDDEEDDGEVFLVLEGWFLWQMEINFFYHLQINCLGIE